MFIVMCRDTAKVLINSEKNIAHLLVFGPFTKEDALTFAQGRMESICRTCAEDGAIIVEVQSS